MEEPRRRRWRKKRWAVALGLWLLAVPFLYVGTAGLVCYAGGRGWLPASPRPWPPAVRLFAPLIAVRTMNPSLRRWLDHYTNRCEQLGKKHARL